MLVRLLLLPPLFIVLCPLYYLLSTLKTNAKEDQTPRSAVNRVKRHARERAAELLKRRVRIIK